MSDQTVASDGRPARKAARAKALQSGRSMGMPGSGDDDSSAADGNLVRRNSRHDLVGEHQTAPN